VVNADFPKQITAPVLSLTLCAIAANGIIAARFPLAAAAQVRLRPETVIAQSGGVRRSPQSYKLGGGDRILVEILEVPDLTRGYEVLSDGSVNLPLIGLVSLRGRTLVEATNIIRNAYRRVLKDPVVTVSLVAARPLNVGVIGEVTRPGNFILPLTSGPGTAPSVQYPTVTQALRLAEGVTGVADLRNIRVRRPQPDGPDQVLNVNLWKFLQEGDLSQDIILQDRDTIVVPTVANFNQAEARQFATANFSPPPEKPRSISIVGQVTRPGAYVVIGGNTTNSESLKASPPSSGPFSSPAASPPMPTSGKSKCVASPEEANKLSQSTCGSSWSPATAPKIPSSRRETRSSCPKPRSSTQQKLA
jgi:polysaccharide export outer membrane protein